MPAPRVARFDDASVGLDGPGRPVADGGEPVTLTGRAEPVDRAGSGRPADTATGSVDLAGLDGATGVVEVAAPVDLGVLDGPAAGGAGTAAVAALDEPADGSRADGRSVEDRPAGTPGREAAGGASAGSGPVGHAVSVADLGAPDGRGSGRAVLADLGVPAGGGSGRAAVADLGAGARPRRDRPAGAGPSDRQEPGRRRLRSSPDDRGRAGSPPDVADRPASAPDVREQPRAGRRSPVERPISGPEVDDRPPRPRRPPGPKQIDPDADPVLAAREICLRLLTDRARTRTELAQALARRGVPDDAAHTVLERFDEVGLIDDAAFAGQWVRSRHRHRGLARRAIAQELRRKGVDDETAGEALAEVDDGSEARRARELVDRKLRTLPADTPEQRTVVARKLVGMLARKGYGAGTAYGVVREALAAHGAEVDELGEAPDD